MRFDEVPAELLERCRGGGRAAFDELFCAIQADLYAFILSHLRRHDEAADVLQECLVRIYKHLGSLKDLSRFPWWIMRIAVNQCHTSRSRPSAEILQIDDALEVAEDRLVAASSPQPGPRKALEGKRIREQIDDALAALPPKQRSAIVLFEIEGMSIRQIAETMECSDGAVKFNIHEARRKLRELLAENVQTARGAVQ